MQRQLQHIKIDVMGVLNNIDSEICDMINYIDSYVMGLLIQSLEL
jgi:hypothetical protein